MEENLQRAKRTTSFPVPLWMRLLPLINVISAFESEVRRLMQSIKERITKWKKENEAESARILAKIKKTNPKQLQHITIKEKSNDKHSTAHKVNQDRTTKLPRR
jgi:hypothetical protein